MPLIVLAGSRAYACPADPRADWNTQPVPGLHRRPLRYRERQQDTAPTTPSTPGSNGPCVAANTRRISLETAIISRLLLGSGRPATAPPDANIRALLMEGNSDRLSLRYSNRPFDSPPGFEHAGNRPGLRGRTAREMWRFRLEDLADGAEPRIEEMIAHRGDALQCRVSVAMDTVFCERIMAEQPSSDGALVIGVVAMPRIAGIMRLVVGVVG